MNDFRPCFSFTQTAKPAEKLDLSPDILAWFKKRGAGWKEEIEGVLDFYIDSVEHPASDFEPGEMDPAPSGPA